MSWRENRQRKRIWYSHYKQLCEQLKALVDANQQTGTDIAAEAILKMFFELYERRRLHKRKRAAFSAWASLELAVRDTGLDKVTLRSQRYTGRRPAALDEFGATRRLGTAQRNDGAVFVGEMPVRRDVDIVPAPGPLEI